MTKTKATSLIALFLMTTIAVTLVILPVANAHDPPWQVPTWCYLYASNNPIGVNQETLLIFWLDKFPPTAHGTYGDRWTFTLGITDPQGQKTTAGPITSDPVGGAYYAFTPDQIGTYTITANFPGHVIDGGEHKPTIWLWGMDLAFNDTYLASTSDPIELVVQEEQIQGWQEPPLPTNFWTRPINSANRDWYVLAGNWLAGAAQNVGPTTNFGYGLGPESAHIMWATPYTTGGIMDARFDDEGYASIHYEGLAFDPPIIMDGRLYYNVKSQPMIGWYCVDLYTGETLYFHNTTGPAAAAMDLVHGSISGEALSFGQIYIFDCPNQHGGFPYLWSTPQVSMYGPAPPGTQQDWMMFDARSGKYICSISNPPSGGTAVYGKDGSILRYSIAGSGTSQYLRCWNSTQALWWKGTQKQWDEGDWSVFMLEGYWYWRPQLNRTYDGSHGYFLNVSLAANPITDATIRAVREDQFVIGGSAGSNNEQGITKGHLWALSLKDGEEGRLLWDKPFTPPSSAGNKTVSFRAVDPEDGVFLFSSTQEREWWCYSLDTMQLLWGPSEHEHPLNQYGMGYHIYESMLLTWGYGGEVLAYNITTGDILWEYDAKGEGFESAYGNYPTSISCIADGKLYLGSVEHSPTQPLFRGSYARCINASDGTELWKYPIFGVTLIGGSSGSNFAISDGYLVALNSYDNQLYCFGKGPSATTVTASPKVSVHGGSVLIEGVVTDQCAGAKKRASDFGYVDGVPAVSDEDQQVWMEYLYSQQEKPTDAIGVEVVLETLDPNGNFYEIGRTTSDSGGLFSCAFTPEVPGLYTIFATFKGSAAYYGSVAETAINVEEAPEASPTPTPPPPGMTDTYVLGIGAGAIIAIIAVGLVLMLMLRKR
jgi:outer membrane protein assembly factor BamB